MDLDKKKITNDIINTKEKLVTHENKEYSGIPVIIKFPNLNNQKVESILKAILSLNDAGIDFDFAVDYKEKTFEWQFDFSLRNAFVEFK